MRMYFVGIDGGGTSCRARIKDSQGNFLGEAKSGSANIMLGAEIAMASILESITSATEQGGLTQQDFASMHVGLALAGAEHKASWQAFMSLPHPFASI
ncbi:glucosamine kinase, partial [Salmonella enterica subsp. enterica serovar Kentucky]|nr:glucosamine kinase [Salmonella enterica subsp. enterica serovar Kentucky]